MGRFVGKDALRTTLDVLRFADIFEVTTATISQWIKWAITKQTIEGFGIDIFVTRKVAAIRVPEEFVVVLHGQTLTRQFQPTAIQLRT